MSTPNETSQQEPTIITEDNLIDYIFETLLLNLHQNEMHFENEILAPTKLTLEPKQTEHLREIVLATGFIKASVGFGKSGFLYLTGNGIQLLKVYKTYSNYLLTLQQQNNVPLIPIINTIQENTPITANTRPPINIDDDMAS